MEIGKTERGFRHGKFKDLAGNECSIQDSSLATQAAIWLGVDDAQPRCSNKVSPKKQLEFVEWHKQYKQDEEGFHGVLTHTRVHLNQDMAANLCNTLRMFCEPGNIKKVTSEDLYGLGYSAEMREEFLLVGPDDPQPQILRPGEGWKSYPYPEHTVWTTKMKLDHELVQDLLDVLVRFIATGTIGE